MLKLKSDVKQAFTRFKAYAELHFDHKIQNFQSDRGAKYLPLKPLFDKFGIQHRKSCPYTAEQNGLAERKHGHIIETSLALLHQASLALKY